VRGLRFERPWELIIVDNGSTDRTAAIIKDFVNTFSAPTRYVFEPSPGLGNARNAGLKIACSKILAFTDDDCYPASDFLPRVWSAFSDPGLGYISGRITLHDPADYPITLNESTTPEIFAPRSFIHVGAVQGANIAFRREVLLEIGGFDPLFGAGCSLSAAEDLDAAARASAAGWKGEYRPEVVVSHHHGRKAADAARLKKSYGIGIGAYHMKLLLRARQVSWFLRSLTEVDRRFKLSKRSVLWEPVGAAKYAYLYFTGQCA
jgi:glycosyltransferase involved in cell wall biosynthesis